MEEAERKGKGLSVLLLPSTISPLAPAVLGVTRAARPGSAFGGVKAGPRAQNSALKLSYCFFLRQIKPNILLGATLLANASA